MWFASITDSRYRKITHAYRKVRLTKGIYATIRMALSPLHDIENLLPERGTLTDVGCGAGLLLQWLALGNKCKNLQLTGIDVDQRRINIGQKVCCMLGIDNKIDLRIDDFASIQHEQDLSAVSFVDVLHHIDFNTQRFMLSLAFKKLANGGVIIIKEVDTKPNWKYIYNLLFDTLTHLTHTTQGKIGYYRSRSAWENLLIEHGFAARSVEVNHTDFAPHIIVIGEKSAG